MKIVFKKMVAMTVVVTMLSTNIAYAATSLAGSASHLANNNVGIQDFSTIQSIPTESLSDEDMVQVEGKGIIGSIIRFFGRFSPKATPTKLPKVPVPGARK